MTRSVASITRSRFPPRILLDILLAVAFRQKRFGEPRQLRYVVHPEGHRSAVEIRAQFQVIGAYELHHVVDVLDDLLPAHLRELPFSMASQSRRSLSRISQAVFSPQSASKVLSMSWTRSPCASFAARASSLRNVIS